MVTCKDDTLKPKMEDVKFYNAISQLDSHMGVVLLSTSNTVHSVGGVVGEVGGIGDVVTNKGSLLCRSGSSNDDLLCWGSIQHLV